MQKNPANIDKIFKLQKRAARIILNEQNVMTPSIVLFNKLKWMPMPDYFVYRKASLVLKSLNQLVSEYLNIFKHVHQVSTRSTRQSSQNLLYVPKSKTEYYKSSFIISGSYLWNDLSENLKECTTIESFKELYLQQYYG